MLCIKNRCRWDVRRSFSIQKSCCIYQRSIKKSFKFEWRVIFSSNDRSLINQIKSPSCNLSPIKYFLRFTLQRNSPSIADTSSIAIVKAQQKNYLYYTYIYIYTGTRHTGRDPHLLHLAHNTLRVYTPTHERAEVGRFMMCATYI